MKEILEIATSGFWSFIGVFLTLSIPFQCVAFCWNRWCRMKNIAANGWPPPHCDADGDFPDKFATDHTGDESTRP